MKKGFTMIELIFVIVILGILAAVAIPKLAATRNDAKIAAEMTSVAQALSNLGSEYTAKGSFTDYVIGDANNAVKCFEFTGGSADGNVSVAVIGAAVVGTCDAIVLAGVTTRASNNGITAANGAIKLYEFGGTGIVE